MATPENLDMEEYKRKLKGVLDGARAELGKPNKPGEPSSLRAVATAAGVPESKLSTIHKWYKGQISTPLEPASYIVLSKIDAEGRTPFDLIVHLKGVDCETIEGLRERGAEIALAIALIDEALSGVS